jgi:ubiquinone biosynthesis protein UbiJ
MLEHLATASVVGWYNHLLAREGWARTALSAHAGRSARIDAGPFSVFLAVVADGTLAAGSGTPSVTIVLDPQALAGSLLDPGAALRKMRMEGDADFAQALTDVLARLRPDPAEDLARFVGDAPAERIVGAVRAALAQLRDSAGRALRQGADYLVAENPLLVGKLEWESHVRELDALQARLGVLEERIGALPPAAGPAGTPRG